MLAGDMMKCAEDLDLYVHELPQAVSIDSNKNLSPLSSIDTQICDHHTKLKLKSQIRCVWCSRVNLMHRKKQH